MDERLPPYSVLEMVSAAGNVDYKYIVNKSPYEQPYLTDWAVFLDVQKVHGIV